MSMISILDPFIDFYYAYILRKKYRLIKDDRPHFYTNSSYQIRAVKSFTIYRYSACEGFIEFIEDSTGMGSGFYDSGHYYYYRKIKRGDLGGHIENESCLSHKGCCWIGKNCYVSSGIYVKDNAFIYCPELPGLFANRVSLSLRNGMYGKLYIGENSYISNNIRCSYSDREDSFIEGEARIMTDLGIHSNCTIKGSTIVDGGLLNIDSNVIPYLPPHNSVVFDNTGDVNDYRMRFRNNRNNRDYEDSAISLGRFISRMDEAEVGAERTVGTERTVTDSTSTSSIIGVAVSDSSIVDANGNVVAITYDRPDPVVMSLYNPLYSTPLPNPKEPKEPEKPEVIKRKVLNNLDGIEP